MNQAAATNANPKAGTLIKLEDLKVAKYPQGGAPESAFAKPEELVGRGVIVNIVKDEPILPAKLASKEAGAGLPPVIPEGMRAISVRVNEVIGVAGYVLPGTHVDVLATQSPSPIHAAKRPRGARECSLQLVPSNCSTMPEAPAAPTAHASVAALPVTSCKPVTPDGTASGDHAAPFHSSIVAPAPTAQT